VSGAGEALAALSQAKPLPVLAGALVYAAAFSARSVRLNLLLPPAGRLPFLRGASLSAAATFLLQVIPFRGGEVASWAAYKRALGGGWARSGAVFALVKAVDTAALFLFGLAGAAVLGLRRGAPALGATAAGLVLAGALGLLLAPRLAGSLLGSLAARLPEGSKRRDAAAHLAEGLEIARTEPGRYALSAAASLAFLGGHLVALTLILRGLGLSASLAGLAFASLTSITTAAVIPSPAGTFGPMESGFAAGLLLDGVPLAEGLLGAALLHLVTTATAGLCGLPFLARRRSAGRSGA
jgi:uncharacterized membrane protein YbhN (UPF0104 family)